MSKLELLEKLRYYSQKPELITEDASELLKLLCEAVKRLELIEGDIETITAILKRGGRL
jgi:hypothetical protein